MKKFLIIVLSAIVAFCACERKAKIEVKDIVVENTISTDRQYMFLNYGKDYRWYESCVVYDNYLDADTTITIAGVSNVFQVAVKMDEQSYDTKVVAIAHTKDNSGIDVKEHAFWVGDFSLNEEEVKLTFSNAFDRLMETNLPKPHSKYVVLRKELGPINANPQYIFGNQNYQVYVDAVNGNVTEHNPVYPIDFEYSFTW